MSATSKSNCVSATHTHSSVAGVPYFGMPGFYSIKQIQALLGGKSRSTVYRWVKLKTFPEPKLIQGSALWPVEEFMEWRAKVIGNS